MGAVGLLTQAMGFRKARATDATDTSFPSKVPTATEPSGDGVHDLGTDGLVQNAVLLVPYGTGDDTDVFEVRVIGWRRLPKGSSASDLWVPVPLCELACTLSTPTGAANTPVGTTGKFCDTVTMNWGSTAGVTIVSPAENVIAHAVVDLRGFQKLEVIFDTTTGDPTGANLLIAFL